MDMSKQWMQLQAWSKLEVLQCQKLYVGSVTIDVIMCLYPRLSYNATHCVWAYFLLSVYNILHQQINQLGTLANLLKLFS